MIRHLVVAAGTLALIACATEASDNTQGSASNLNANNAGVPVTVLAHQDRTFNQTRSDADLVNVVRGNVDLTGLREARVEDILSADGTEHLVVTSLIDGTHSAKTTRLDVDSSLAVTGITQNYARAQEDEVHGTTAAHYACPDPEVQFVSLCPNNNSEEIGYATDVANSAKAAGLKTVLLTKSQASHDAWLNYMACPKLEGNFYDGDANTQEIVVSDGSITAREFTASVNMGLHVTNIWLACEAYNNPMLQSVQKDAKSQKYAAGINDLAVGPSDKAAVCAMKAAIAGKPMTAAFQSCYSTINQSSDHWGFGGDGSDMFGQTSSAPTTSGTGTGSTASGPHS